MNDSNNTSYAVSAPARHDVKRASPIGHDVVERPLKRPKTAKACVTCRQVRERACLYACCKLKEGDLLAHARLWCYSKKLDASTKYLLAGNQFGARAALASVRSALSSVTPLLRPRILLPAALPPLLRTSVLRRAM